ncbi:MAG TPA: carbohydrate binding domain-containing protein, partial [Planctomycetota bacterium]|nr:carbohydrate binding domain-containing protein [Planctomycetota bacterium]
MHAQSGLPIIAIVGVAVALVGGLLMLLAFTGRTPQNTTVKPAGNLTPEKQTVALIPPPESKDTPSDPVAGTQESSGPRNKPEDPARTETVNKEFDERRQQWADKLLDEAREFARKKPDDVRGMRDKLNVIVRSYRSTPAGEEASRMLADLKLPPEQVIEGNLAADPGMESGGLGVWKNWGAGAVYNKESRTGLFCARISKDNSGGIFQKLMNLKPNTTYELSGWAKSKNEPIWLGVKEFGGAEKKVSTSESDYKQLKLTFTPDRSSATIFVWKDKGKVSGFADDLCVLEIGPGIPDPPAPPAPADLLADDPAWKSATNLLAQLDAKALLESAVQKDGAIQVPKSPRSRV